MEKTGYFEPKRLKRAVKRLDYVSRWLEEEFREKRSLDTATEHHKKTKRGFLSKLLDMLKSEHHI